MSISVVICAYTTERWDDLSAAVASCFSQTLLPDQVIVVIDYNDELYQRAKLNFPEALVVDNRSTKGLSGARNTGVATSTGDVVVFLDDDACAEPTWLENLTKPFTDDKVAGVGGWIVPHWPGHVPPWFPESFYWVLGCSYSGLPLDGAEIRNPIGASMAVRRRVFDEVGGFSAGLGRIGRNPLGCEETELCIRYAARVANDRFVLSRHSVVHHRVPASRLTWHYFWTRCWAEGMSKAAVSSLVGSSSGLAAERAHVMRSLPRDFARSVFDVPRAPRAALTRAYLIAAGTILAVAGVLRGRVALHSAPISVSSGELEKLSKLIGED